MKYTNAFTKKMDFTLHVVLDELETIDRYAKGLPWKYIVPVKQKHIFEAAIWTTRYVEDMINKKLPTRLKLARK